MRRVVVLVGAVGAVWAGAASPAGAIGARVVIVSPSPNLNGWINTSGATVYVNFDVDGFASRPRRNGDYDELINKIACSGTGVSGGNFSGPGALAGNFGVVQTIFNVTGDSPSPSGVGVGCTATYERLYYSNCFSFFGCGTTNLIDPYGRVNNGTNIKIDHSPPVNVVGHPIIAAAALNWHNVATVANFSGQDPNSGIQTCSRNVPISGPSSTLTKVANGSCTNFAGLTGHGGYAYRFDNTPPSLAPTVSPDPVLRGATATASPHATDAHSGIASATCGTPDTSTIGAHTVACTARDVATNVSTANAEYTVAYGFSGFRPPVDAHAANVVRAGQAIPLKFKVFDSDGPVKDLAGVTVRAVSASCDLGVTDDLPEERSTGRSGLRYLSGGRYRFVWKSPKSYANSCKTLKLDLGDHIAHTAEFRFTK